MQFKTVYQSLAKNWLSINDPDERKIMKKYAQRGKTIAVCFLGKSENIHNKKFQITFTNYVIFYSACTVITTASFIQLPLLPIMLDKINPLNKSRNKILIVRGKFPIDPVDHYFLIHLNLIIYAIGLAQTSMSIDPMVLSVVYHFMGITSVIKLILFVKFD